MLRNAAVSTFGRKGPWTNQGSSKYAWLSSLTNTTSGLVVPQHQKTTTREPNGTAISTSRRPSHPISQWRQASSFSPTLATSTTLSCVGSWTAVTTQPTRLSLVQPALGGSVRTLIVPPIPERRRRLRTSSSYRRRPSNHPRKIRQPSLEGVHSMPISMEEMDNPTLVVLGELGDHEARKEILKRHIMTVDNVTYDEACKTFAAIAAKNQEGQYLLSLPYKIGIAVALTAALASFPLCFNKMTAEWFNERYVTTDVPESEDLETWLEVGAWTWNCKCRLLSFRPLFLLPFGKYLLVTFSNGTLVFLFVFFSCHGTYRITRIMMAGMEPPLGQISFVLLCLQFSRAQLENLGIKPYTQRIKRWRAEHLASVFPQYDSKVVMNYSESTGMMDYRRH